jgi:hypothetical protein
MPGCQIGAAVELGQDFFGDRVQHIVVKNFGRGSDFLAFDQSEARTRLDELGGHIIELPELQAASMFAIDHSAVSFWAAIHTTDGERALRPLDRQRVRIWLERCYAALQLVTPAIEPLANPVHSNWTPVSEGQPVTWLS